MVPWSLKILETPEQMQLVEMLQRLVWSGSETDVVPLHVLLAVVHNGGLLIGAFEQPDDREPENGISQSESLPGELIGFVFGFPGLYITPDGPRLKHHSHMLGVHPHFRNRGVGFALKRAQWQMVRYQGIDRITWTYDPLMGPNALLNIARLGAVCNTYMRDVYGSMRDDLNTGLPSDRFLVDWWVNTKRVERRLSTKARLRLDLAHFLSAGAQIINPSQPRADGLTEPAEVDIDRYTLLSGPEEHDSLLLVEVPADFPALKRANLSLALAWRLHTRSLFEELFARGYLATDFIYLPGMPARSFYVLSHGESTL